MNKQKTGIYSTPFLVSFFLLTLVIGCSFLGESSNPPTNPASFDTQVAQTLISQLPTPAPPSITPILTSTQVVEVFPSQTPLLQFATTVASSLSATYTFTITASPSFPVIQAQVDTNCRLGPSTKYPRVGYLLVGQQSFVVGKDSTGKWWVIENPKQSGEYCWVWGETTTVTGDISGVAMATPPPLPSGVEAGISFSNAHICDGTPTAVFRVVNTGERILESVRLSIKNLANNKTLFSPSSNNSPFMSSSSGCPGGKDVLLPGSTGYVGGGLKGNFISGQPAQASLTVCSEENLDGDCISAKIQFTIP